MREADEHTAGTPYQRFVKMMAKRVPEVAKANKAARVLWLLKLISQDTLHLSELAVLLGCSERSVQRDLVTLQEAGVVLLEGQGRGYYKPDKVFWLPL